MTVGKICSRVVETAAPEEFVSAVAQRMLESKVGSLPVLEEDGRLVGIVTDRDLALRVLTDRRDSREVQVAEVMSESVQTIREDATIEVALGAMRERKTRRLPVVDAGGKLVGILSLDDVLALLSEEFGTMSAILEAESPGKLLGHSIPDVLPEEFAPRSQPWSGSRSGRPAFDLGTIEKTLGELRDSLDVVACALSVGLEVRLLGGGVIEGDLREAAEKRLHKILKRARAENQALVADS
ncbi:MAG: CBS domain-containing protein [Planctomycetota bacterium]